MPWRKAKQKTGYGRCRTPYSAQYGNQLRNGLPLLRAGWLVVVTGAEARVATGAAAGAEVCGAGALPL